MGTTIHCVPFIFFMSQDSPLLFYVTILFLLGTGVAVLLGCKDKCVDGQWLRAKCDRALSINLDGVNGGVIFVGSEGVFAT